jgi:hypothetical protein
MPHYFTREEAEALLPDISIVLHNIQQCNLDIRSVEKELHTLHLRAIGDGHHLREQILMLQSNLERNVMEMRRLLDELHAFGCELKDPDIGLIDFLALRNGREVYLCWHLGEDRIRFWHDLDAGFVGRQPL